MRTPRPTIRTLVAPITGVLFGCLGIWQLFSVISLTTSFTALLLDHLMPLTAVLTLGLLLWLFAMVDAGNRGEDADAQRARCLVDATHEDSDNATSAIDTSTGNNARHARFVTLRGALVAANESSAASRLTLLNESHTRLLRTLDDAFSSTELSYHRYRSLADGISEQAIARLDAWLTTAPDACERDQLLDDLETAVAALDVASLEVTQLALATAPGSLVEAARELADLAARAPRLAGH